MVDRPILFSAPMVRALLGGRKTQTRRVLKPQPAKWEARVIDIREPVFEEEYQQWGQWETIWNRCSAMWEPEEDIFHPLPLRFGIGDRLWVKETAAVRSSGWHHADGDWYQVDYAANFNGMQRNAAAGIGMGIRKGKAPKHFPNRSHNADQSLRWHPSIFMPRWASRLTLLVTDVRVERLQDCSEADALAEGIDRIHYPEVGEWGWPQRKYAELWDSINGPGAWDANPWIVAVTFTVGRHNIDAEAPHG